VQLFASKIAHVQLLHTDVQVKKFRSDFIEKLGKVALFQRQLGNKANRPPPHHPNILF
jgi:hypothetical protein